MLNHVQERDHLAEDEVKEGEVWAEDEVREKVKQEKLKIALHHLHPLVKKKIHVPAAQRPTPPIVDLIGFNVCHVHSGFVENAIMEAMILFMSVPVVHKP